MPRFTSFSRAFAGGALILGLAACGDTVGEQAILGGAAGAGTAAVAGGSVATGAVAGAAGNVAYCAAFPQNCN